MGGRPLKISYHYLFGLPRKIVWKYLKNENVLRNSLPSCKSFEERSRGVYEAELEINIGPAQDHLTLEIRIDEEKPPLLYRLQVKGKGILGEVDAKAELKIKESQGTSKLFIVADVQLTGALAIAGERILEAAAHKGLEQFFRKMEKEIKMNLYKTKKAGR